MPDIILYVSLAILAIGIIVAISIIGLLNKKESSNTETPKASPIITAERPKTKKATKKPTTKKQVDKIGLGTYYVPINKRVKNKLSLFELVNTWRREDTNEVYFYTKDDRLKAGMLEDRSLARVVDDNKIDGQIVQIEPKELTIRLYYR